MKLKTIIQYIIDFPFWIVSDIRLNVKSIPTLIIFIFMIWYVSGCKTAKSCGKKYQWQASIEKVQQPNPHSNEKSYKN